MDARNKKMPVNLASPGIRVREVDLTVGRVDPSSSLVGALVAPFAQGPVELPTLVGSEKGLLEAFGKPYANDKHYEHWLVASSYLAYGGSLQVVRADDDQLKNAFAGAGNTAIKIKSDEHYEQLQYDENVITDKTIVARNPGSWANGIRIGIIDAKVDQILSGVSTDVGGTAIAVGMGVTQGLNGRKEIGVGTATPLDGHLKGIITEVGADYIGVKVLSHVSAEGIEYVKDYQESGVWAFKNEGTVAIHTTGASIGSTSYTGQSDWFSTQNVAISTSTVGGTTTTSTQAWSSFADRPGTTKYAAERGSRFDEVHVLVIDGEGKVTGNAGTILEKHLNLSKATDAEFSVGSPSYWRSFLKNNSEYIFGGDEPTAGVTTTGYSSGFTLATGTNWDQSANSVIFAASGNQNLVLSGGKNYDGNDDYSESGSLSADLNKIVDGYSLFESKENYDIDFLLMGSANYDKETSQALANKVIAVADIRKDALAFISPYRKAFINDTDSGSVTVNNADTITNNVLSFYSPITSSSYAVFDSGYKYMFDRFTNTFRYVPLNGDIAGLCARTDVDSFPWFSPAGTTRGSILNAVKLTYNPTQAQRDKLYSARINPVIVSPGGGINLFGDKTGLERSSAFDRINVRRLFIFLEEAISGAARDQLFEFNDQVTRSTFVSIVDPFLRDVQAKRGIQDYVVICDETNNTAAVIDNNEFVADIFIKPNRSINFIGLTFVATRTGVSFEEVVGNV